MKNLWKRTKPILLALMYVAIYYAVSFAVQIIYTVWQNTSKGASISEIALNVTNNLYALTIISVIITFWIYLIIGHKRKKQLDRVIVNQKMPSMISIMAVCLAVGLRMLVTVYFHYSQNVEMLKQSIDEASAITPQLTGTGQLLIACFATVLIAPLFEELLFRGIVMEELKTVMRPWAAIVLQAVLFGVAHGVLFQSIFAVVIGVILGVIYHKTKSFNTAVVCHSAFNFSVIMAQSELNLKTSIIVSVLGIVLVVFSMIYILSSSKKAG